MHRTDGSMYEGIRSALWLAIDLLDDGAVLAPRGSAMKDAMIHARWACIDQLNLLRHAEADLELPHQLRIEPAPRSSA